MRTISLTPSVNILLLLAALLTSCNKDKQAILDSAPQHSTPAEQLAEPGVVKQTVVLIMDGTRVEESFGYSRTTEGYSDAYGASSEEVMPSLQSSIVPIAGISVPAYSTGVTTTMPSHSTLLQGRRRAHGSPATQEGQGAGLYRPELPTFFELVRKQFDLPVEGAVLVGNTVNLISLEYGLHPDYGVSYGTEYTVLTQTGSDVPSNNDTLVLDEVQAALEGGARFVLANLHNIDRSAHNEPETYSDGIVKVDGPIVRLWNWIQSEESGLKDETLLVITADHGRHRFDVLDPVWSGHGDDCSGCREIPLLMVGPGVAAGSTHEQPATLEDVHQTIAWLMGVDSPYADGVVLSALLNLDGEAPQQRTGEASPAQSGELAAFQRWRDDAERRSEIVLDGEVFDDQAVFAAEMPEVLAGERADYACWRQLNLNIGTDYYPWTMRCLERLTGQSEWTDIGFPLDRLPPDARPSLVEDAEGNFVVAVSDLLVTEQLNIGTNSQISLAIWRDGAWEVSEEHSDNALALDPALQTTTNGFWVAYARGADISLNRYTRHIEVQQIWQKQDGVWNWTMMWDGLVEDSVSGYGRMEHPALWMTDTAGQLAFFGYTEDSIELLRLTWDGAWSPAVVIDNSQPLSHVQPVFSDDGALFWARYGASNAQLCRLLAEQTDCVSLSSTHIERIAVVSDDEVAVSVLGESKTWSLETVSF